MGPFSTLVFLVIYQAASFPQLVSSSQANLTKVIESFHVRSDVRFRFATTQIESVVRNTAEKAQEIVFEVTLPKEAFIVSFSMEIDGKVYPGEVKEKTAAKKDYLAAVSQGQSAGHVRQAPRHSNIFEVSANVVNGSAAKFTLTYQEMLRRKLGVYEHEIHVSPGQPVEDFLIEIFIQENKPLRVLKTPSLRMGSLVTNKIEAEKRLTIVDRPTVNTAHITYRPSIADQSNSSEPARFIVEYDVEHSLHGDVMVADGYFIHFFAPDLSAMPKDIVFVLDVSGSMSGTKIEQLKLAMLTILADLQSDDRFSIITFSSNVKKWKPELVYATTGTVDEAKHFIRSFHAQGGTDINSALLIGVSELIAHKDDNRVGMIFFLTDGEPTVGVQNGAQIASNVLAKNSNTSTIFSLAFGHGADYDLLVSISTQNSGFARKIYEDSDAALQVASLYEEISAVSATNISVNYLASSVDEYTVTSNKFPVIFKGSEVIICGRMADNAGMFQMEIKGMQKSGTLELVLQVDDVNSLVITDNGSLNPFFTMPRDFSGIVEKMWAYLTVKQYLKQQDLHVSDEAKAEDLKNKILQISLKYKFVTPLTSMVVTKPENPEKPMESGLEDSDNQRKRKQDSNKYSLLSKTSSSIQYYDIPSMLYGGRRGVVLNSPPSSPIHNYPNARRTPVAKRRKLARPTMISHPGTLKSDFPLMAAIRVGAMNISLCLAPKKIKDGTYNLIKYQNGTELNIETTCVNKKCKDIFTKKLVLKTNRRSMSLSIDKKGDWVYQNTSDFTIAELDTGVIGINGDGLVLIISWKRSKNFFEILMTSVQGLKGLIGDILNMPAKQMKRWRKFKVPPTCKDKNTDISKVLTNTMAARYKV